MKWYEWWSAWFFTRKFMDQKKSLSRNVWIFEVQLNKRWTNVVFVEVFLRVFVVFEEIWTILDEMFVVNFIFIELFTRPLAKVFFIGLVVIVLWGMIVKRRKRRCFVVCIRRICHRNELTFFVVKPFFLFLFAVEFSNRYVDYFKLTAFSTAVMNWRLEELLESDEGGENERNFAENKAKKTENCHFFK